MKAPVYLFELIQSLSPSEKRYLRLQADTPRNTDYMKLFEAIDKQEEYDEEKIKKQFAKKTFIKRLPAVKDYLYQFILKCLASYHTNASSELKNNLHHIDILFRKCLYKQCENIIELAKKSAYKYENHLVLLELLYWEVELARVQGFGGKTEIDIQNTFEELYSLIEKYKNRNEYWSVSLELYQRSTNKLFRRNADDVAFFNNIIKHPLLDQEDKAMSYQAKFYYYHFHSSFFALQNDPVHAYPFAQKVVKLMEEHPHQIKENPAVYVTALFRKIGIEQALQKYKELHQSMSKLKGIKTGFANTTKDIFFVLHISELIMYTKTAEFNKGQKLIEGIEAELIKLNESRVMHPRELILYYMMAINYFALGNYASANKYLNKILTNTSTNNNTDLQCLSLILSLIIHFELGNVDLLEYFVKSTYRFLYKRNRVHKFETIILNFIKKSPASNSEIELIKAFKKLKLALEEISNDPLENRPLEYFDYIAWLESKIENKPFAEIVRGKANRSEVVE